MRVENVYTILYTDKAVGASTALFQGGTYWGTRWDFVSTNCHSSSIQKNYILEPTGPNIDSGH